MFEQIVNGIVLGSMYSLIAIGYTLVFGLLDKLNMAHGEVFVAGGFVGVFVLANDLPLWVAFLVAALIGGLLGLLIEFVSFRKFKTQDAQLTAALSTVALGMVMTDLIQKVWGTEPVPLKISPSVYTSGFDFFGAKVTYVQLSILFISIILMYLLTIMVQKTKIGRFMRAVSENTVSSSLLGINAARVIQVTFFISSVLAAIAGIMFALRTGVASSTVALTFALKALAIMTIGGLGDLRGALYVGLGVGVVEALAFHVGFGSIADLLVWILLIVTLIFKPAGLFTKKSQVEIRV